MCCAGRVDESDSVAIALDGDRSAALVLSGLGLGADYVDRRRNSDTRQRRLIAQLEATSYDVTIAPAA